MKRESGAARGPDPTARVAEVPAGMPPGSPESAATSRDGRSRPERLPVLGLDRRTLAIAVAVLVVAWLVFVFGRAITDSAAASDQADSLRAQNAVLAGQLQARQDELAIVRSPAFVALEARAYGLGRPREQVFSLQPGAPTPGPVVALGEDPAAGAPRTPLDAWMLLLIGR